MANDKLLNQPESESASERLDAIIRVPVIWASAGAFVPQSESPEV